MQKNFVIDNGIALEGDHFYLDVHNCYSLVDFEMNTKSGKSNINISFKKAEECFLDGRPFNFRMSFLIFLILIVRAYFLRAFMILN